MYFRLAESVQGTDFERIFKTDDSGTEEKEDEVQTATSEVKESHIFEQVTIFLSIKNDHRKFCSQI